MFSEMASTMAPTTLTLFTGGVLLTRSWLGARRDRLRQQAEPEPGTAGVPTMDEAPGTTALLEVRQETDSALRRLAGEAARQGVRLEVAIEPGLRVFMPRAGFRQVLDTIISHAIAQACGGKVMIGAMRHGGRIRLVILDDGVGADRMTQESRLRDVTQVVALQGGTVEITTRHEGSVVAIRLPEAASATTLPAAHAIREAAEPASNNVEAMTRTRVSAPAH